MNMFDEANALFGTIKMCKTTQSELAARLGVSQSYIANKLRLLKLSPDMRDQIVESGLSERHARALLKIREERGRRLALARISAERLNVSESEALIDDIAISEIPTSISNSDRDLKIERIRSLIDASVSSLQSSGIYARSDFSREGGRLIITLDIEDAAEV